MINFPHNVINFAPKMINFPPWSILPRLSYSVLLLIINCGKIDQFQKREPL